MLRPDYAFPLIFSAINYHKMQSKMHSTESTYIQSAPGGGGWQESGIQKCEITINMRTLIKQQ